MAEEMNKPGGEKATGYHDIDTDSVISVDEVTRQAKEMAEKVPIEKVAALANNAPYISIENLNAGYGKMEILHDFNLQVARKQSLCLIGPNGAGKSTILHSIFGFTNIFSGKILIGDGDDKQDITGLSASQKLRNTGIAYILQDFAADQRAHRPVAPRLHGYGGDPVRHRTQHAGNHEPCRQHLLPGQRPPSRSWLPG